MRSLLLIAFVGILLPFAFMRPQIGVLLWSWLSYMNPHRLTWGFTYGFPFVAVVAAVTLAGLPMSRDRGRLPISGLTTVWILFVFWFSVTTLFALNPEAAQAGWSKTIKIQLMVLVTLLMMQTTERVNALVWIIAASIGFYGLKGGIFAILTGGSNRVLGPPQTFISGNNEIAFALLIVIPLIRYLQMYVSDEWSEHPRLRRFQFWAKWSLVGAMGLSGLAVMASYSRGAFLAGAAMLVVLILKSRKRLIFGPVLIIAVILGLSFMPQQWSERMQGISNYQEDRSAMGRINAWNFALNLAKERPVLGGGFETFTPALFERYAPDPEDYHDSHSIYFEVLAEQGYVGLALFMTMGILVLMTGSRIIRLARDHRELKWASNLAAMLQVSFVGYAAGGAFIGLAYFDLPYHLMALMVLTRLIVERDLELKSSPARANVGPQQITRPAKASRVALPRIGGCNGGG